MNISVLLFAAIKDRAGQASIDLELNESATVADLRAELGSRFPEIRELIQRSAFAFENEFLPDDRPVENKFEIACIPPVSGG